MLALSSCCSGRAHIPCCSISWTHWLQARIKHKQIYTRYIVVAYNSNTVTKTLNHAAAITSGLRPPGSEARGEGSFRRDRRWSSYVGCNRNRRCFNAVSATYGRLREGMGTGVVGRGLSNQPQPQRRAVGPAGRPAGLAKHTLCKLCLSILAALFESDCYSDPFCLKTACCCCCCCCRCCCCCGCCCCCWLVDAVAELDSLPVDLRV